MNKDVKLLLDAAKAIGFVLVEPLDKDYDGNLGLETLEPAERKGFLWNPLRCVVDTADLEIMLGIGITWHRASVTAHWNVNIKDLKIERFGNETIMFGFGAAPYVKLAAKQRAVVQAAARIANCMG